MVPRAKSTKFAKVIVIAAAAVIVAAFGVAYALDQVRRYGEVPCQESDVTTAGPQPGSSMIGFTTLEEIVENSEAIVIAEVESCIKVHSHPKAKEIRLTDFQVTVEKAVKGDLPAGKTLTVQIITSGVDSDHLMKPGERYVFFLTYNQITSSHAPVGGPQGRFIIDSGDRVYSIDAVYPEMGFISVKADGRPLGEFLSEIQSVS